MSLQSKSGLSRLWMSAPVALVVACGLAVPAMSTLAQEEKKDDFRPFAEVSKDFEKVVSTADGAPSLFTVWKREKDGQLLAELPRTWQGQKHFIALTIPTGEIFAGLQAGDMYVYWKRFDKRMALIMPNTEIRSTGDTESKDSLANHFTDRVILDVPIECMGPGGQPVIDLDNLLLGNASTFYGSMAAGLNPRLGTIAAVKAFPENVEVSMTAPTAGGRLKTFHWSISQLKDNPAYKPRAADERVGYFTTSFRDLGKFRDDQVATRYINRWHLEKKEPKLKISPPKQPIVYYVEHTVPARYRRWVKEGTLYWNKAFEEVGIRDAIEVYYQDKETGAHMDKDPEDVRYNFIRWLANDIGTAVGPSRAHPLTGEILDADIVLTDGWIRHFWYQANEFAPSVAMEGFGSDTMAWLDKNPQWDPRVRLAKPEDRSRIITERAMEQARRGVAGVNGWGGAAIAMDPTVESNADLSRLSEFVRTPSGLCMMSEGLSRDMAVAGLYMDVMGLIDEPPVPDTDDTQKDDAKKDEAKKDEPKKDDGDRLDGIPEWFVGPALAHLTAHEVGHTLGLRHNFKASSQYTLSEINSEALKGKPNSASVMDYSPININMDANAVQGDYSMIGIGSYDMWAIEYGYTLGETKDVLKKVNQPGHMYLTDEDTGGPDPLARRYDWSKNPIDYAKSLMQLANLSRGRIIEKFVKDGEPWSKARRGYEITLSTHLNAVSIMSGWIGGAHINRDRKGDPDGRVPIEPVPAQVQRDALDFIIANTFFDDTFGLTPELLVRMTVNKDEDARADPTWPINDRIAGVQSSALTMLMNPGRLRRVYDNELYKPADQDAVTLPEVLDRVTVAVWKELDGGVSERFTPRKPMISSLRRNLQREHADRLIDLAMSDGFNEAGKTISTLAALTLRQISSRIEATLKKGDSNIDAYTLAHLSDVRTRIDKALDAGYIRNASGGGGFNPAMFMFGQTAAPVAAYGAGQNAYAESAAVVASAPAPALVPQTMDTAMPLVNQKP